MFRPSVARLARAGVGALVALSALVCAAAYSDNPFRIVVPYGGGAAGAMAHLLAIKPAE